MSYEQTATVYDAIYTKMKDYPAEARRVIELWEVFAGPETTLRSVLDVACGTGLHLEALRTMGIDDLTGFDLSEAQLAVAKSRLGSKFHLELADMTDFGMGRYYDLVTCLFSAVGHLPTFSALCQAIEAMASHLEPGGIVMIEPWIDPDDFREGHVGINVVDTPELKVLRMGTSTREGNLIHLELKHIVGRPGVAMEDFSETHQLMMFSKAEFEAAFSVAGLSCHFDEQGLMGRGLYIGVKAQNKTMSWGQQHVMAEHLADEIDGRLPTSPSFQQSYQNFTD